MTCHTEREPNRGGCDAVVIDRVTLDLQDPFTVLNEPSQTLRTR
jgi:hypothetical protein